MGVSDDCRFDAAAHDEYAGTGKSIGGDFAAGTFSTVGYPYAVAVKMLEQRGVKFAVCRTMPPRSVFKTDESTLRVVREQTAADGSCILTVACEQQSILR